MFTAPPPTLRTLYLNSRNFSYLSLPQLLAWVPWMQMRETSSGRQKQTGSLSEGSETPTWRKGRLETQAWHRQAPTTPELLHCRPRPDVSCLSLSHWLHLGHVPTSQLEEGDTLNSSIRLDPTGESVPLTGMGAKRQLKPNKCPSADKRRMFLAISNRNPHPNNSETCHLSKAELCRWLWAE